MPDRQFDCHALGVHALRIELDQRFQARAAYAEPDGAESLIATMTGTLMALPRRGDAHGAAA
ncbi:hypothetical protein [Bradyrhizobium sp.]|uniref:hypothetical protein n=1 Tax=Bradyrhizobium sp. TaxID=376 RepID=UPI001EC18B12|nr:hypothetical protein [Bradyrhizobium sp.]MBV9978972.1 hypothetical protein [Bradyrhizobium sp.]